MPVEILLDGRRLEAGEGTTLGSILGTWDSRLAVAVIRPRAAEAAETQTVQLTTTKGEVVVELLRPEPVLLSAPGGEKILNLHWGDRVRCGLRAVPGGSRPGPGTPPVRAWGRPPWVRGV